MNIEELNDTEKSEMCSKVLGPMFKKGFRERLTDKGKHVCKTLRSQYLQGNKMKEVSLAKLLVLFLHDNKYTWDEFQEGEILADELQNQIYDITDVSILIPYLVEEGLMEKNPEFDYELSIMLKKALHKVNTE